MAAALIIAAVVAPWLVWLPVGPLATIALGAIALVGAFHGWGRLLARLTRSSPDAVLATAWGIALVVAIAGVMIAINAYDARFLVLVGTAIHSADLVLRLAPTRDELAPRLAWARTRYWLVPLSIALVVIAVHASGAAGQVTARAFDDDGDAIAQVERVSTTGALADPIGYPRVSQLGGNVTLAALATAFAEPRSARLVDDGIGFGLLLLLVLSRIRPRDATTAIWASSIVVTCAAVAAGGHDVTPLYLPAALILAVVVDLDGSPAAVALAAGALWAIRDELAPVAIVLAAAAWWRGRQPWREDLRRIALLVGLLVAAPLAYAIARSIAWFGVDHAAAVLVVPTHVNVIVRLLLSVAIAAAIAPLLLLILHEVADARLRWLAAAAALGVGGALAHLTGGSALQAMWPVAIASLGALAIALAHHPSARTCFVAIVLATIVVHESFSGPLTTRWRWREFLRLADVEFVRHAAPEGGAYGSLLASIPAGDTVAVWVTRPELLDYTRHRIFDLRTPRIAPLRDSERFDQLLAATHARWLLVERDDAYFARVRASALYGLLCPRGTASCSDSLERLFLDRPSVAQSGDVRVIALIP